MDNLDKNFVIHYRQQPVQVEVIRTGKDVLYRITGAAEKPGLFLTRAKDAEGNYFWTSVPEGKQELANTLGLLIEKYINDNQSSS